MAELRDRLAVHPRPVVIDVRSRVARELDPRRIPGAAFVSFENVDRDLEALPRGEEIIVYCSCPSEASAARVAEVLIDRGFPNVRPLLGGLEAWIDAGHPVERLENEGASVSVALGVIKTTAKAGL